LHHRPEPDENTVEAFIRQHPGGAEFQEIATVFGCSHQRIQQVLAKAYRKIYRQLSQRNIWHLDDAL
jgi:hypothetical protein